MQNILFADRTEVLKAEVKKIGKNLIQIMIAGDVDTSGFTLLTDSGNVYGRFADYTTLYRVIDGGYVLSNDGSVYVEPEPLPEIEETLEQIKEQKLLEMEAEQQRTIANGVDVLLSDGEVHHFTLTANDQISLMGLESEVAKGTEYIPWHTSNQTEHCQYFSNADMKLIVESALSYVTYHVTYFRDLRIYINSMLDKESVETAFYGMQIPTEYQSEVLADMYSAQINA